MKLFGSTLLSMGVVFSVSAAMSEQAINDRLTPVGKVCVEGDSCASAAAPTSSGPKSGEDIYNSTCAGCHGTGALGAPKLGDTAAWAPRIAQGDDVLLKHAISGLNSMPPKGTCSSCSDDEIASTIKYMVDHSK